MKTYWIEFGIDLPEGLTAADIEMILYKGGLKHFGYAWSTGSILKVEDAEE